MTPDQEILRLHEAGYSIKQIAKKVGLGIGYVTMKIRKLTKGQLK